MDMFPFQISGLGSTATVKATSTSGGLKVDWQYSGNAEYFYVQLWRNGTFRGNTKVASNLRTYTYAGEVPSASNKLHFVVYAQVPGSEIGRASCRERELNSVHNMSVDVNMDDIRDIENMNTNVEQ